MTGRELRNAPPPFLLYALIVTRTGNSKVWHPKHQVCINLAMKPAAQCRQKGTNMQELTNDEVRTGAKRDMTMIQELRKTRESSRVAQRYALITLLVARLGALLHVGGLLF